MGLTMNYIDILRNRIEEQKRAVGGEGVVAMTCNEVLGLIQAIEAFQRQEYFEWDCPSCGARLPSTEKHCPCGGMGSWFDRD
jgi:hypothetical protein